MKEESLSSKKVFTFYKGATSIEWRNFIKNSEKRRITRNTKATYDPYRKLIIITFNEKKLFSIDIFNNYKYDTGGDRTYGVKKRLNQLGVIEIKNNKKDWIVFPSNCSSPLLYKDGMVFDLQGNLLNKTN